MIGAAAIIRTIIVFAFFFFLERIIIHIYIYRYIYTRVDMHSKIYTRLNAKKKKRQQFDLKFCWGTMTHNFEARFPTCADKTGNDAYFFFYHHKFF